MGLRRGVPEVPVDSAPVLVDARVEWSCCCSSLRHGASGRLEAYGAGGGGRGAVDPMGRIGGVGTFEVEELVAAPHEGPASVSVL